MWAVKCVGCKDLLAPNATSIVYHYRSTWNRDDINFIACPVFIVAAQETASRARIEAHLGHTFPSAPFIWDVTSMVGVWLASFHYAGHCWLIRISWWTKNGVSSRNCFGSFWPDGELADWFRSRRIRSFFLVRTTWLQRVVKSASNVMRRYALSIKVNDMCVCVSMGQCDSLSLVSNSCLLFLSSCLGDVWFLQCNGPGIHKEITVKLQERKDSSEWKGPCRFLATKVHHSGSS